jgi:Bifunctional DNA primase/polymerase, N-terminal
MDDTLKTALELHERGLAVHWLHRGEKSPVNHGWSQAAPQTAEELEASYQPGYNVGFRPGKWSIVDGFAVVVLDTDVRGGEQYCREAYAARDSLVGDLKPTVVSGSGYGRHDFLLVRVEDCPDKAATVLRQSDIKVDGGKNAWQIELLSTGKNVVLPPSIHPETGRQYTWCTEETK